MSATLDYSQLYRLPFSKNDNFNGWLEVTTACNTRCPGCYRGCDRPGHTGEHRGADALEREILELRRIRNCSMISLSGGEPLLHPDLDRIVAFVKAHGMSPVLFTNGLLLTRERLAALRQAGLTAVAIRTDSLQEAHRGRREAELAGVRAQHARLCAGLDVFLVLTVCVDHANLGQVAEVVGWAQAHAGEVGQLLLILKRDLVADPARSAAAPAPVSREALLEALSSGAPHLRFAAYLGSQAENLQAKWLQAFRVVLDGELLGYADRRFVELVQVVHHLRRGSYLGLTERRRHFLNVFQLSLLACANASLRTAWLAFLGRAFRRPSRFASRAALQALTVVIPPHFVDGRRDLCDACPDAMLYDGRLVPSCGLEEIRRFGATHEQP